MRRVELLLYGKHLANWWTTEDDELINKRLGKMRQRFRPPAETLTWDEVKKLHTVARN